MISLHVKVGLVKNIIKSYFIEASLWSGICPDCGIPYVGHGSYIRKTPFIFGPFKINRVRCDRCGITHALIPCFIIPYSRARAIEKEVAITSLAFNIYTIEEIAEFLGLDPTTIAWWWKIFKNKSNLLLEFLSMKLADFSDLSTWLQGDYKNPLATARKIFELIGIYRRKIYPDFSYCNFALINLINPYLLSNR